MKYFDTVNILHAGSRVSNTRSNIKVKARKCKLMSFFFLFSLSLSLSILAMMFGEQLLVFSFLSIFFMFLYIYMVSFALVFHRIFFFLGAATSREFMAGFSNCNYYWKS